MFAFGAIFACRYVDYAPAIAVATDKSIESGHCVITDIKRLLGCPG